MRALLVVALLAACAEQPVVDDGDPGEDGKEDAAGATLCDSLPAASKELCSQIPNNGWRTALRAELTQPYFEPLALAVAKARAADAATTDVSANVYPSEDNMFAALRYVSPGRAKVVILGQDPYIGVGQAIGLSFSVAPGIDVPPSLQNVYAELVREAGSASEAADLPKGFACPADGDLRPWAKKGVFMLNAILTVQHGAAGSHADFGWQKLTDAIIGVVRDRNKDTPVAFMLWGSYARAKKKLILEAGANPNLLVLESNHPSPLASGFVGNGHFAAANAFLVDNGRAAIDWSLPVPAAGTTTTTKCTEL